MNIKDCCFNNLPCLIMPGKGLKAKYVFPNEDMYNYTRQFRQESPPHIVVGFE